MATTHRTTLTMNHLVTAALVTYLPFHLLEEGLFGFPAWAETYWRIPDYTVGKWLFHNVFFVTVLLIGYIAYQVNKERYLSAGFGIILWGGMNTFNHVGCSVAFGKIEPGLFTSLVFLLIGILAIWKIRAMGRLSFRLLGQAVLWNVLYWGVPILLFMFVPGLG